MTQDNNRKNQFAQFIKPSSNQGKKSAEERIRSKTATPPVKPSKTNVVDGDEPPINNKDDDSTLPLKSNDDVVMSTNKQDDKSFLDFFEKKFTTENSDLIAIDRGIKNKIALLCSTNRKTSQLALVSNIIQDWFDTHEKEINKQLKSVFK